MKKILILVMVLCSMVFSTLHAKEVTMEEKITGLYVAFFNRAADEEGLTYWTNKGNNALNQSNVLKELAEGFATHPSFDRAYGNLINRIFVEEIYKNALGRDGDVEGINYWTERLNLPSEDASYLSRSDFVSVFVEAALTFDRNDSQYVGLSKEVLDAAQLRKDLITNKVEVALAFTHQLASLSNVTDNDNPESDPAYLASIKIISEVTEDYATVEDVLIFLKNIEESNKQIVDILNRGVDIIPPIITLNGVNNLTLYMGDTYDDLGAEAVDERDGPVTVLVNGEVNTAIAGTYVITYTTEDSSGNSASIVRTIYVLGIENTVPVAVIDNDTQVEIGQKVELDGSRSQDADGDTLSYRWYFVSRPEGSSSILSNALSENPSLIPDALGNYVIALIVSDDKVESDPVTVTVSVIEVVIPISWDKANWNELQWQ